jgi:succinate dehydrogenase/fumarate reductase flavoprotein subunit
MRTAVPALFVAGAIRNTDPGIYFGGWNICKTMAFGCWAGESAVKHIELNKPSKIDETEVMRLKSSIYETMGESKITGDAVLEELQNSIFPVVVIKNKTNLTSALKKVQCIKAELTPRMRAIDTHQLGKVMGIKHAVLIAEVMLSASLMRTETRASHYREDHPHRIDEEWLKWIVFKMRGDKLDVHTEPLPLERYRLKAWNCYSDKFRFPEKESK